MCVDPIPKGPVKLITWDVMATVCMSGYVVPCSNLGVERIVDDLATVWRFD